PALRAVAPSTNDLIDIFDSDAIAGKLLILGAPGGGKTTALLVLARELAARADASPEEPVPVILGLSSWDGDVDGFAEWVVGEVKSKYGVRRSFGRRWLNDRRLVPLFDGLDEVPADRQEDCVRAINRFHAVCHPTHLVVCCRLAEYEALATH